jgi:hypothetical protein
MIDKGMMVLQSYSNSENILVGPYGETYPACHDGNQAMNIKDEEVSDTEEEPDPMPMAIQEIKAEPEVSWMSVCTHCYAIITNMPKCQLSFSSPYVFLFVCAHVNSMLLTGF